MPPLMLRWRPLHITILSLGGIASTGWAADAPLCPSQPTAAPSSPVPERKPDVNDGAIDIQSDHATLGVDGNAILKGNVNVRQGDRQIRADEIEYNSKSNGFRTDSGLEYEDPVVKITGDGGDYSPSEGANFRSADLRSSATCRTRIRRRAPADTSGCHQSDGCSIHNMPGDRGSVAAPREERNPGHGLTHRGSTLGDGQFRRRTHPLPALVVISTRRRAQERISVPDDRQQLARGGACGLPSVLLEHRAEHGLDVQPIGYCRRGIDLGGDSGTWIARPRRAHLALPSI